MRIYEYNESDKALNTECGLFHIGDTVQLTEIDSQTPIKTVLYGAKIDSTEYVLSFFDKKCGMSVGAWKRVHSKNRKIVKKIGDTRN